ncbi:hypothetical protein HZC07_05920 [Candidatus Micrarchaeota archaeon]|nr:hypothetical protein [Candidatus Micrarchaeota archaeon]
MEMGEVVVDTSIVVAGLLRPGTTRNLIFTSALKLYSPEQMETEIRKNRIKFMQYGKVSEEEFESSVSILLKQIVVVQLKEYLEKEQEARKICSRDETDWPFVALALTLNIPIWSLDPDLLKGQKVVRVVRTSELIGENKREY